MDASLQKGGIPSFLSRWRWVLEESALATLVADLPGGDIRFSSQAADALLHGRPRTLTDVIGDDAEMLAEIEEGRVWEGVGAGGIEVVATALPEGALLSLRSGERPHIPAVVLAFTRQARDAILMVDPAGVILHASLEAQRLFGPLEGHLVTSLPIPAVVALTTGDGGLQRWRCAAGEWTLRWQSYAFNLNDGTSVRVLRANDVTQQHEAQLSLVLRMRRIEAMHVIALAVGKGASTVEVSRLCMERLHTILPLRESRISLSEEGKAAYILLNREGRFRPLEEGPGQLPPLAREAWTESRVVQGRPEEGRLDGAGVKTGLFVPVVVEGEVAGVFEVYSDVREVFSEEEVEMVTEAMALLSTALVKERLMDRIARHAEVLERRVSLRNEELHRTQDMLVEASKLSSIGEMAAGLVHELNQPLNVLTGYIELFSEEMIPKEGQPKALTVMARAVEKMRVMVQGLRDFSRAGGRTVGPVSLRQVAEMARELTAGATGRVAIEGGEEVWVLGDQSRLEQVVVNLLANALAVSQLVRVDIEEVGESARMTVSDRGPGVKSELREKIFQPFFTTKARGQGTGLGLSVSARIVVDHGGGLRVEDNAGGGAVFVVDLPRLPPEEGDV